MKDAIDLVFNEETGMFEEAKEPYMTIEFPTKGDYDLFNEMIQFYNEMIQFYLEHHKQEEN